MIFLHNLWIKPQFVSHIYLTAVHKNSCDVSNATSKMLNLTLSLHLCKSQVHTCIPPCPFVPQPFKALLLALKCSLFLYHLCLIWLLIYYYTFLIVGYFLSGFVFSYTHPGHVKSTVDLWWTNYNVSFLLHPPCSSCQAVSQRLAAAWCTVGVSQETFAMASFCLWKQCHDDRFHSERCNFDARCWSVPKWDLVPKYCKMQIWMCNSCWRSSVVVCDCAGILLG